MPKATHIKKTIKENKKLKISEEYVVSCDDKLSIVSFYGPKSFKLGPIQNWQLLLIKRLVDGLKSIELSDSDIKVLIFLESLDRRGLLHKYSSNIDDYNGAQQRQLIWLSSFVSEPLVSQKKIERTHICILGCGGTGSIITQHLVANGFQKFTLIDHDQVELSNLNRQFTYSKKSIGKFKTEVLKDYIYERNSESLVFVENKKIESSQNIVDIFMKNGVVPDILICCADRPLIQIQIAALRFAIEFERPVLFGAVGLLHGSIGPFLTSTAAQKEYLQKLIKLLDFKILNTTTCQGSVAHSNSLVSSIMAGSVFDYVTQSMPNQIENSSYEIHFNTLELRETWRSGMFLNQGKSKIGLT